MSFIFRSTSYNLYTLAYMIDHCCRKFQRQMVDEEH